MDNLTLGSLFDGSGGFPLGGLISGITPVWASEIEPFPIRVTTKRLPFMKHYGDISQMDGGKIEPVDIITFGSPCQDMSVAGKRSGVYEANSSRTLDANGGNPSCNQGGIAVVESYVLQNPMIGREDKNGFQGDGVDEDVATIDRHAVYAMTTGEFAQFCKERSPTLMARDYKAPTLVAEGFTSTIQNGYTVRRLMPTECARLQGFPDWWCDDLGIDEPAMEDIRYWYDVFETHRKIMGTFSKPKTQKQIAKWLKKPYSDAAEYKMWGNGVALPCVAFVLCGIVWYAQNTG